MSSQYCGNAFSHPNISADSNRRSRRQHEPRSLFSCISWNRFLSSQFFLFRSTKDSSEGLYFFNELVRKCSREGHLREVFIKPKTTSASLRPDDWSHGVLTIFFLILEFTKHK